MFREAAKSAGVEPAAVCRAFPGGVRQCMEYFFAAADAALAKSYPEGSLDRQRVPERMEVLILSRLAYLLPHREAVRRSLTLMALPQNLPLGAKLLYEVVDTLWHAAGDSATDFNFYTKRGLLAGVYAATTLYWLDDRSAGNAATEAFLERRLAEVQAIPRLKSAVTRLPNPLRILRAVRARST